MKNYTLERLPGEPIVLFHGFASYNWHEDFPSMADEVAALLDNLDCQIFLIADMTDMSASVTDLIFSTNYATRNGNPFLHHSNMREFLAVTTNKAISLAAKGMNSPIFGSVPVCVFGTQDEALAYARSNQ